MENRAKKKCKRCNSVKLLTEFYKNKSNKDGFHEWCKECMNFSHNIYYQKNKEEIIKKIQILYINNKEEYLLKAKKYREENKEKMKEKGKKYYKEHRLQAIQYQRAIYKANPKKIIERTRNWQKRNPEKTKELKEKWVKENSERRKELNRKWYIEKFKKTPKLKLSHSMSVGINDSLRGNKNGYHWEFLVNYTIDDLKRHLEKQFKEGMTWENYGRYGWHIDHKIPISVFNFNKAEDIDFQKCWALSNLQPMWHTENISKGAKLSKPFQPSLAF